jgi:hypothetical protein
MKRRILIIVSIILIFGVLMRIMYAIDMAQMKENKPVVFSTWGIDYAPAESIQENEILTEGYQDFEISVVKNTDNAKIIKVLNNKELYKDNSDYNLYYYGLSEVNIKINNKILSLEDALKSGKITLEEIIAKAYKDANNGEINWDGVYDGGTREYYYGSYTIIKKNTLDGNKDVWIGISEMRLKDISYYN